MIDFEVKPLEPAPKQPEVPVPPMKEFPVPPTPPLRTRPLGGSFWYTLSPMKWILFILAIAVVAIGFVMLFFGSFRESGVVLEIEALEQIQSGEEVTYKVRYKNESDVKLENVHFSFLYPLDSVVIRDGRIKESLTENIELDDLDSGTEGEMEFRAFVVGDTGDIRVAKARLTYQPSGVRSEFDKEASFSTTITSFAIPLTLSTPPSAISGQEVRYTLDYRNESDTDFAKMRIKFKYPDGFNAVDFKPTPDVGTDVWNLSSLGRGGSGRIEVVGTLIGREDEEKTISATLQREVDGNFVDFEKTRTTTVISSPPLLVSVKVNGKSDYIAKPGDRLRYEISFTNTSRSILRGVNLSAKLEGAAFDKSAYEGDGFFDAAASIVLWNASNIPILADLQPGQSAEAKFNISLHDPLPMQSGAKNFFVRVTASLETTNVPKEFGLDKLVVSQDLLTKIATNLNFIQTAHYSDPAAGFANTGPVPPRVGQQTTYTIHWTIDGTSNDVVNAKIVGFLPPGVTWTGNMTVNANQPQIVYDAGSGKVSWNVQVVPAGTGTILPKYIAIFQVAIIPTTAQLGREMELMRQSDFEGQDGFTKEKVEKFAFPITTDDVVDQKGRGEVE